MSVTRLFAATAAAAAMLTACATAPEAVPAPPPVDHAALISAAVANENRPDNNVERDEARQPGVIFGLAALEPGDRVLDLGAGGGYLTRIAANIVGDAGMVVAQNPQIWVDRFETLGPSMEQLEADNANIDTEIMEFDALAGDAGSYDAVIMALIYHDTVGLGADRAAMNARVFELLKPGGAYIIEDHNAEGGSGERDTDTLHRVDAALVRSEVEAAGFVLDGEDVSLVNADDDLTLNVFDPEIRGRTSRFDYRFVKPAG